MNPSELWPELALAEWQPTYDALHLWTQVVGKICLHSTPKVNHYWNATLRVSPRGLITPVMFGTSLFTIEFDFISHQLEARCSSGAIQRMDLVPCTVSDFYSHTMAMLDRLAIQCEIPTLPDEMPNPVPFEKDLAARPYDPDAAHRFWRTLVSILPVFERFRAEFIGKCSPVHFFWGSFDLAVTRFSGRRAPDRPGADKMTREAYSHEVISHGFWPGGGAVAEAAFYAYAAPEPSGLKQAIIEPPRAAYNHDLNEFILPYDAVRQSPDPEATLMSFLHSTYNQAADLADWPRAELERRSNHA